MLDFIGQPLHPKIDQRSLQFLCFAWAGEDARVAMQEEPQEVGGGPETDEETTQDVAHFVAVAQWGGKCMMNTESTGVHKNMFVLVLFYGFRMFCEWHKPPKQQTWGQIRKTKHRKLNS